MTKAHAIVLLLPVVAGAGCIVRPAAETILTVRQLDGRECNKSVMGLRKVLCSDQDDKLLMVGHGWHPQEHETYVSLWIEPYPVFLPRWLRITSENNESNTSENYMVELLLDPWLLRCDRDGSNCERDLLYVGHASCRARSFLGKVTIKLKDVELARVDKPTDVITVSGRVVAKRKSAGEVLSMSNWLDFQRYPDVDANPSFIWEEQAIQLFGVPKAALEESKRKNPEEPGYVWSGRMYRGFFYRKEDIERLAQSLSEQR